MAEQLKKNGLRYELITVPGGGHGLAGGDKQLVERRKPGRGNPSRRFSAHKPLPSHRGARGEFLGHMTSQVAYRMTTGTPGAKCG